MTESVSIRTVSADEAAARIEALADVLMDCVEGGASVSFMLPLAREKAVAFFRDVAAGVAQGKRALGVAEDADGALLGTVQLVLDAPENQPHRAEIAKLLVHRRARRLGLARRLLQAVEQEARRLGKTLLVLDTVTGGEAEQLYLSCGWQRVGVIPNYALTPDGAFCSTTVLYKAL